MNSFVVGPFAHDPQLEPQAGTGTQFVEGHGLQQLPACAREQQNANERKAMFRVFMMFYCTEREKLRRVSIRTGGGEAS